MKQKIHLLIILFQLVISSLYCQEKSIGILPGYEEDSTSVRFINTPIMEDSVLNIIFVLPVEELKDSYRFGNGLSECKELIDSNKISNNVLFVQPDYKQIPWYGNNTSKTEVWQMEYTVDLIKTFREKYSANETKVYLLGFSKSGFGSMNIIMKHSELVDGLMIWDAPLSTTWNENWGMQYSFGTKENFMKNYYLMREEEINFEVLRNKLLIIGGYNFFENQTKDFLQRLDENNIKYIYDDSLRFKHEWNKDWIYELVQRSGFLTFNKKYD